MSSCPKHIRCARRRVVHYMVSIITSHLTTCGTLPNRFATSSCLLEAGIFTSHIVWLLRTRKIRREAAAQDKTFDDVLAEHEESGAPFKYAERKTRKEKKKLTREKDVEAAMSAAPSGVQIPEGK